MPIPETIQAITTLCDKADKASEEYVKNIPGALAKHGLDKVQAKLAEEVGTHTQRLNAALAQLPQTVFINVTQAVNEAGKIIADTRESVEKNILTTLAASDVAPDIAQALQKELTNHRRRFAKMRAVLAQSDVWKDPEATEVGKDDDNLEVSFGTDLITGDDLTDELPLPGSSDEPFDAKRKSPHLRKPSQ
ncbi:hypothetical protein A3G69_05815 [Candidatus Peribacteria bacterium RIFCSPLOWO2_12_FULL_53_10]|nr:MAG: hypothetical protein A3B61_00135 [Candidatus Peribacteria bacterium RIFCSPLOWO2_01_FULL_53_10]OGJ69820.1 MAG: hypothetical protein A3G69_05815 [Candidatus Peribacteria bacterium RIFCSPLOWO2_12_FULL_53_10]